MNITKHGRAIDVYMCQQAQQENGDRAGQNGGGGIVRNVRTGDKQLYVD